MKGLLFGFYLSITFPAAPPAPEFYSPAYNERPPEQPPPLNKMALEHWTQCLSSNGVVGDNGFRGSWGENRNKKGIVTDTYLGCLRLTDPPRSLHNTPSDWLPHNLRYDFGAWFRNQGK